MKLLVSIFSGLFIVTTAIASPLVAITGTVTHSLIYNKKSSSVATSQIKEIKLLKIAVTGKANAILKERISTALMSKKINTSKINAMVGMPSHVELGMNKVPVLDQGSHGTCVTFAVTAALDAILGQGDYISQLCPLTLGTYIENNTTYRPSGWDGSSASITLSRIAEFGIVSKEQQRLNGCGGMTEYPLLGTRPYNEMSLEDYHRASIETEPFYEGSEFKQTPLMGFVDVLLNKTSMANMEAEVKKALYQGDRVLLGVFLPMTNTLGLDGLHHVEHDSWVLNGRTAYLADYVRWDVSQWGQWGGHEMIITGFDDAAVAVDNMGQSHQGLFTLRNSWGEDAGDQGTFYMSYDYFRALAIDLIRIGNQRIA